MLTFVILFFFSGSCLYNSLIEIMFAQMSLRLSRCTAGLWSAVPVYSCTPLLYNRPVLPPPPEDGGPVEQVEHHEQQGEHAQEDQVRLRELVCARAAHQF